MPEGQELPDYISYPTEIKIEGEKTPIKTAVELREPKGEVFLKNGSREIIAPKNTDFPVLSGTHLQLVDRGIKSADLNEPTILSRRVKPKDILALIRMGIITERRMVEQTGNVWANLNLHSRPPVTSENPIDAQYDSLTLDVHGRNMKDASNWAMSPPTHGAWGAQEKSSIQEIRDVLESFDERGNLVPATPDEIEKYKHDPDTRVFDQTSARVQRPEEYRDWKSDTQGKYNWDNVRRRYTPEELSQLRIIFGTSDFLLETASLDSIELFTDPNPLSESFEPNDSDIVLWEFGGYQLVTQEIPLVDAKEGIHMVLKLRPEPHTPWDNPKQTLEAYAIGIGVARLLRDTESLGDIGDVYLDMNANWSMGGKRESLQDKPLDKIRKAIQQDTRAHLHIQLEKMTASWEIPPAPGTFVENQPQSPEAIKEIRQVLNDPQRGLKNWIFENCAGKLPL